MKKTLINIVVLFCLVFVFSIIVNNISYNYELKEIHRVKSRVKILKKVTFFDNLNNGFTGSLTGTDIVELKKNKIKK